MGGAFGGSAFGAAAFGGSAGATVVVFVALPLNPYGTTAVAQAAGAIELNPYGTISSSVPASLE